MMKFCLTFRRKTSSKAHQPMAMAKPADFSSTDDLAESLKSLSMHLAPSTSPQTAGNTQGTTQTTTQTQDTSKSTPPTQSSIQITVPTVPTSPTQSSTQVTVPTQTTTSPTNSGQPPPQQPLSSPLPTFPVRPSPICRKCNNECTRRIVRVSNKNNNEGRPFYTCKFCKEDPNIPGRYTEKGWISWDDDIGIRDTNRACECGVACRQGRAGVESRYPGGGFWTCAYGSCNYLSYRKDFLTDEEAVRQGFDPFDDAFLPWQM